MQLPGRIESGDLSASLLNTYQRTFSSFLEKVVQLKNKIYEAFSYEREAEHQPVLEIDSAILSQPLSTKIEEFNSYSSVIGKCVSSLLGELQSEQLSFLKDILNSPVRI